MLPFVGHNFPPGLFVLRVTVQWEPEKSAGLIIIVVDLSE